MPRGPLPTPDTTRRRTNTPTIPTTLLPAEGRSGPTPKPPKWMPLGDAGRAWWRWAWKTPQAAAWDAGCLVAVARRARLEDLRAALRAVDGIEELVELLEQHPGRVVELLEALIGELKASAAGALSIDKEADQLDDRLGLNPKARASLRWAMTPPEADGQAGTKGPAVAAVRRLRAVDASALAGA